ncbi:MAG: MFS transporter [Acidobacteria bacterium]|nr:MFS transporter [Acidobacteriota bacterium]MDA1233666.1 MFS transporter [Acidobacteriota bacterium]
MSGYFRFLASYRTILSFGLVMALSSSFGQTFFISLFLPYFMADFDLTKGDFGILYGGCTLLSALCLPRLGSHIDRLDLKRYTAFTIVGLAVAALTVSTAPHVAFLALGIVGLRLSGQGLLGHISQTVMAREFAASRGKALGVAGLGYPLGEAVLPLACTLGLQFLPWTAVWQIVSAGAIILILPLALGLLSNVDGQTEAAPPASATAAPQALLENTFGRDLNTYLAIPVLLAPSFVFTGLFLYQVPLAEWKGWDPSWVAVAFSAFAVSRALSSIAIGGLIDRFSAVGLFPFFLMPLGAAVALFYWASSPLTAFPYLMLIGMTAGANSNIGSALWAELYGVEHLGRIRSVASSWSILGAAASPILIGGLFRLGFDFNHMLLGSLAIVALSTTSALLLVMNQTQRLRLRRAFGR